MKQIKGEKWSFSHHSTQNITLTQPLNHHIPRIMESAINVLVSQFKTYAGKDGSVNTLSKDEFQSLVTAQLPNILKNASDPTTIDQLMSSLDVNNDGELTFLEFWQLIGSVAKQHGGF